MPSGRAMRFGRSPGRAEQPRPNERVPPQRPAPNRHRTPPIASEQAEKRPSRTQSHHSSSVLKSNAHKATSTTNGLKISLGSPMHPGQRKFWGPNAAIWSAGGVFGAVAEIRRRVDTQPKASGLGGLSALPVLDQMLKGGCIIHSKTQYIVFQNRA